MSCSWFGCSVRPLAWQAGQKRKMGIREEIEKLREPEERNAPLGTAAYNVALDDVLSLLDEHLGNLVREYRLSRPVPDYIRLTLYRDDYNLRPGDRIFIYIRRKDDEMVGTEE